MRELNREIGMYAEIEQIDKDIDVDIRNEMIQDIIEKYEGL